MKTSMIILMLLSASQVRAARADRPVICVDIDSTEKNVSAPIVPEGGIKKLVHEKFQKKEIETINSCRSGYFGIGYYTHGRLEIHISVEGSKAKDGAGKVFDANTTVTYYEITSDGRNEKKFSSTVASEKVQESQLRDLLKSTVATKVDDCINNVQASLKKRAAR